MKHRLGTRNKRGWLPWFYALVIAVAFALAAVASVYVMCNIWLQDLPDYEDTAAYNLSRKTRVYAGDGTTLLAEFYLENREPVESLADISPYVTGGTVATEDVRFYEHNGVDYMGIARALWNNLTGGHREGGSTLTQQLVRNTVLTEEATEQSVKRKVREAYIAFKLEQVYTKDEILLTYLNTVNYGSGAYGIQAAAQRYYSVNCDELTLPQAALLAGIPQSPTYNNPINYPENALERRNLVLRRMVENNYISREEYDAAVAEPLNLNPNESHESGIYREPYFTSYVRQELLDMYPESQVFKGGLNVYTTIDLNAQALAEEACAEKEAEVDPDLEVALVAVEPSTGFIKAMVGGKDYDTDEFNLATQATRQPGSSFKTFTLAAAIENGIDPDTYVDCSSPVTLNNWTVENYGGASYGTRTIESAFAISSNTGFARLCTLVTPAAVADMARRCGVETELEEVPSITLGSQGVTVREMAGAYATIATGGIARRAVGIERITAYNGDVIYEADTTGTRVISEEVAHAAEQVMETVIRSGTGTPAALSGQVAAGKTGTSQNWRDSWFCGITPQYSVAIWLGARYERSMDPSYTASSVFAGFLDRMLYGQMSQDFPMDGASEPDYRKLSTEEKEILNADGAPAEEKTAEQLAAEEEARKKAEEEARKKAEEEEAKKKAEEDEKNNQPGEGGGDEPGEGGDEPAPSGGDDPGGGEDPGGGGDEPGPGGDDGGDDTGGEGA